MRPPWPSRRSSRSSASCRSSSTACGRSWRPAMRRWASPTTVGSWSASSRAASATRSVAPSAIRPVVTGSSARSSATDRALRVPDIAARPSSVGFPPAPPAHAQLPGRAGARRGPRHRQPLPHRQGGRRALQRGRRAPRGVLRAACRPGHPQRAHARGAAPAGGAPGARADRAGPPRRLHPVALRRQPGPRGHRGAHGDRPAARGRAHRPRHRDHPRHHPGDPRLHHGPGPGGASSRGPAGRADRRSPTSSSAARPSRWSSRATPTCRSTRTRRSSSSSSPARP